MSLTVGFDSTALGISKFTTPKRALHERKCQIWAVVKWSACLPSIPTIRVRIPLKPAVFLCLKKSEKEAGVGPFFEKNNATEL